MTANNKKKRTAGYIRAHAFEQGIVACQLIEELIRQHLDRKDKDK